MQEKRHYPEVLVHELVSSHVAQTFSIKVLLPLQHHGESTRFPVVYLTDGNFFFDIFKGMAQADQAFGGLCQSNLPRAEPLW
jgi:predicted alpha/beta superfamily hydrolase